MNPENTSQSDSAADLPLDARFPEEQAVPARLREILQNKAVEPTSDDPEAEEPSGGPRVPIEDEETLEATEAEAGREAAADEQAENGRRVRP